MEIPEKYVMPCKTNGMCRSILLSKAFPDNPRFQSNRVQIGTEHIDFKPFEAPDYWEHRVTFRCCTGCYQPFNNNEAIRLNAEIGLELPTTESLRDRMAKLRSKVRNA